MFRWQTLWRFKQICIYKSSRKLSFLWQAKLCLLIERAKSSVCDELKWTKLLITPRRIFARLAMSSTVCSSRSPSCGWENQNLLSDPDVFLQFPLIIPVGIVCLIRFSVLTIWVPFSPRVSSFHYLFRRSQAIFTPSSMNTVFSDCFGSFIPHKFYM